MRPASSDLDTLTSAYTAAWNSGDPDRVASFFADDGEMIITRGEPWIGRAKVCKMAAGFHADVPDLKLQRDAIRGAGDHVIFLWTFTGHDASTGNALTVSGWEEWDFDDTGKVSKSLGWFDADNYARQVAGE